MDIIKIDCPEKGVSFVSNIFYEFKSNAHKKIGYKGEEYIFGGRCPFEFTWINGRLFKRSIGFESKFFFLEIGQEGFPEIVCECGGTHFEAMYGDYELKLKCVNCGIFDVVYSG